jgi:hypothetical protein
MTYKTITCETEDRVAIITFNRPERLNAFSLELRDEVAQAIDAADRDPDISVPSRPDTTSSNRQRLRRRRLQNGVTGSRAITISPSRSGTARSR